MIAVSIVFFSVIKLVCRCINKQVSVVCKILLILAGVVMLTWLKTINYESDWL